MPARDGWKPAEPGTEMGRSLSWSQISYSCGYQLKFHRFRYPRGLRGARQVVGDAVHAGIQWGLTAPEARLEDGSVDVEGSVRVAIRTYWDQLREERDKVAPRHRPAPRPWLAWDKPAEWTGGTPAEEPRPFAQDEGKPNPRMTKGKPAVSPRMLAGHEARIDSWRRGLAVIPQMVRVYLGLMGGLRVSGIEVKATFDIEKPAAYRINAYLDILAEEEETGRDWVVDLKSSGKPWDDKKLEEKSGQARLYMLARFRQTGRIPRFEFHLMLTGTETVLVYPVEWDRDDTVRLIEHRIRPTIAAIEAGVYVPNVSGWWHSPEFCSWWNLCPLGAAASKAKAAAEDSHPAREVA